jgi:Zn-dependent protease with chaperone function
MITALALLGYVIVAAWWSPVLLARLTSGGVSVRPGLAAWLSAMASVLMACALGTASIVRAAEAAWPTLTRLLCQRVAGAVCTPRVYRSMAYSAGVNILAILITLAALAALCRYVRRTRRTVAHTRLHAQAARLAGYELAGTGAVVLNDPRPVAYCAAGRPPTIVVSSGAVGVLDKAQLAAVLAHEHAHLAGRHHLFATVTQCLAATLPRVPLFSKGADEVARLAELAADDTAARSADRRDLVAALLAISLGAAVPRTAPAARGTLAAAVHAVPARIQRLLDPPGPGEVTMFGLALGLISVVFLLAPTVLAALAG